MEIRKLSNGYQFVNNSRGNRSGFVHETTLFNNNGLEVGNYKVQYYNRTWECYQFQTVMKNCISKIMEKINFVLVESENYGYASNYNDLTQELYSKMKSDFAEMIGINNLWEKIYE